MSDNRLSNITCYKNLLPGIDEQFFLKKVDAKKAIEDTIKVMYNPWKDTSNIVSKRFAKSYNEVLALNKKKLGLGDNLTEKDFNDLKGGDLVKVFGIDIQKSLNGMIFIKTGKEMLDKLNVLDSLLKMQNSILIEQNKGLVNEIAKNPENEYSYCETDESGNDIKYKLYNIKYYDNDLNNNNKEEVDINKKKQRYNDNSYKIAKNISKIIQDDVITRNLQILQKLELSSGGLRQYGF